MKGKLRHGDFGKSCPHDFDLSTLGTEDFIQLEGSPMRRVFNFDNNEHLHVKHVRRQDPGLDQVRQEVDEMRLDQVRQEVRLDQVRQEVDQVWLDQVRQKVDQVCLDQVRQEVDKVRLDQVRLDEVKLFDGKPAALFLACYRKWIK